MKYAQNSCFFTEKTKEKNEGWNEERTEEKKVGNIKRKEKEGIN